MASLGRRRARRVRRSTAPRRGRRARRTTSTTSPCIAEDSRRRPRWHGWPAAAGWRRRPAGERTVRWGPRTLDADVITVDVHGHPVLSATIPELTLPHPRAAERAFVLLPWAEIDPTAELPGAGADRRPARADGRRRHHQGRSCALTAPPRRADRAACGAVRMTDRTRMGFTRWRDLAVVAVVAAVGGLRDRPAELPADAAAAAAGRAGGRPRRHRRCGRRVGLPQPDPAAAGQRRGAPGPPPVPPLTAARAVMAAKATSLAGAAARRAVARAAALPDPVLVAARGGAVRRDHRHHRARSARS